MVAQPFGVTIVLAAISVAGLFGLTSVGGASGAAPTAPLPTMTHAPYNKCAGVLEITPGKSGRLECWSFPSSGRVIVILEKVKNGSLTHGPSATFKGGAEISGAKFTLQVNHSWTHVIGAGPRTVTVTLIAVSPIPQYVNVTVSRS